MKIRTLALQCSTLLTLCVASIAHAQVTVSDPWVRATTSQQKATGAFMKLDAAKAATLLSASSPVAGVVEIHEMVTQDGVMKMRAIPDLPLPAGKTTELKPGSYHLMLMDLKEPLNAGQKVPVTLVIEAGQQRHEQTIEAEVRPLNSMPAAQLHQHGKH